MAGWRLFGVVWLAMITVGGLGAAALQAMGPPGAAPEPPRAVEAAHVAAATPPPAAVALGPPSMSPWPGPPIPGRAVKLTVQPPDPALSERAPHFPDAFLPRIDAAGRMAMQVYARPFDAADKRPRVAVLVTGLGMSDALSRSASEALPPEVTFGLSPYARDPAALLARVTAQGHEFVVTLPMESQGYPLNDSGPHALLTGADPVQNARNLEWVLSRAQGYAGLSGASDGLRGERFAALPTAIDPVLKQISQRGLLYVDARPNAPAAPGRVNVTAVLDDPPERGDIDARLASLEQQARDHGWALGLAGPLRPVTIDRIASWARGLDGRGIALVPVSALVLRSQTQ